MLLLPPFVTFFFCNPVLGQVRSTWPPDVVPDPTCLAYDGSKVPDCRDHVGGGGEPVFIEHSFSKTDFTLIAKKHLNVIKRI